MNRTKIAGGSRSFVLLIAAFVANTLLWAAVVNVGYPPDELSHADYARRLVVEKKLPVYGVTQYIDRPLYLPHASLPPLYYLLAAPFAWLARSLGTLDAVVVIRLLSIGLGALTVACAWRLGTLLVPERPAFALAVATLVGFNPMFTYVSASVNSDNLLTLLSAALACHLTAGLLRAEASRRWLAGLGVLLGAFLLTKPAMGGPAASAATLVLMARHRSPARLRWLSAATATVAAVTLLVAGWFLSLNWTRYGDPMGIGAVGSRPDVYAPQPYRAAGSLAQMLFSVEPRPSLAFLAGLWRGYWGIFDHYDVLMPGRLYGVAARLTLVGFAGTALALVFAWRRRRDAATRSRLEVAAVGVVFCVFTVASVVAACYWIDYQPQGRYLFPAVTWVAAGIVVGCEQLAAWLRVKRLVAPLLMALVVMMNVAALVQSVWPSHRNRYLGFVAAEATSPLAPPVRLEFEVDGPEAQALQVVAQARSAESLRVRWTLDPAVDRAPLAGGQWAVTADGPLLLTLDITTLGLRRGSHALTIEAGGASGGSAVFVASGNSPLAVDNGAVRVLYRSDVDAASWHQLIHRIRTGESERLRTRVLPWLLVVAPALVFAFVTVSLGPLAYRASPLAALALLAAAVAFSGPPLQIPRMSVAYSQAVR